VTSGGVRQTILKRTHVTRQASDGKGSG